MKADYGNLFDEQSEHEVCSLADMLMDKSSGHFLGNET
jgi:hypothetical protein